MNYGKLKAMRPLAPPLLLLLSVVAVYGRLLGHDFLINWDDAVYVTANSSVHGFSVQNLRTVFTSYYAGNYAPLQMLSYMCDYTIWGLWPGGYLLTNIIIHSLNGLLIYGLLLKSHGEKLLALVAAGLFLFHPVQVESVAWISQRKNLLAMFFMLIAFAGYVVYRNSSAGRSRLAYCVSVAAFICSLLSKSASVFFPVALVLYDYCFCAGWRKVRLTDKTPFLFFAGAAALLAVQSQSPGVTGWSGIDYGGRTSWHGGSPWATFLTMIPVLLDYLRIIVWPSGLSAIYAPSLHTTLDITVLSSIPVLLTVIMLSWRIYRYDRRTGYWVLFSVLALLPVSQIIPLVTLMNDRYLYFPMIGVAALGGAGAVALRAKTGVMVSAGASLVLVMILAIMSFQRAEVWKNSRTLWSDAAHKVPEKFEVWEGLGEAYQQSEPVSLPAAEYAYSRAFALYSSGPNNLFNLARVKLAQGDVRKAVVLLQKLLKINPQYVTGWAELGDIWLNQRHYSRAEHAYKIAESLQPEAIEVNIRLFRLYSVSGDSAKAKYYSERVENLGGNSGSGLNP